MAEFSVERWRVVVVALATIAALPLFVMENPDTTGSLTGVARASGTAELASAVPVDIVVDAMGQHAGAVCRDLQKAGFTAAKLSGGISAWRGDNLPVVK